MLPFIPVAIIGTAIYGLYRYFNPAQVTGGDVQSTQDNAPVNQEPSVTDLFPKAAPYADAIDSAQNKYGIPSNFLAKLLNAESAFRADIIEGKKRSSVGATGIAQLMPTTAADLGVNPLDPIASIDGAGRYLSQLYDKFGTWEKAIAAYNWGPGNVERKGLAKAPAETVNYVQKIAGVDITQTGA